MVQEPGPVPRNFIDIDNLIREKNPRLFQILPRFILRYIKRVVHQNEVNSFLANPENLHGQPFVESALQKMGIQYTLEHEHRIPAGGRYIFVANHPLGGLDGLVLINEMGKRFGDVRFVVNDILMHIKPMESLFVPVNKHGKQSSDYVKAIDEAYDSDCQILYFPAGLCSRKIKGKIIDLKWQKSFIAKAVKYQRDIIPVYISGKNSNFFYNLASLRKAVGIKANIEMFYLVDEMLGQKNKSITLRFGEPVSWKVFDKSQKPEEWAARVRELVYSME